MVDVIGLYGIDLGFEGVLFTSATLGIDVVGLMFDDVGCVAAVLGVAATIDSSFFK
jgi:hypothetical protein